jgi:dienelactone hydrolase
MLTSLFFISIATGAALTESAQDIVKEWMESPVLESGATDREIRDFIVRRVPELLVPASASEWEETQAALRKRMLADIVYRGVPEEWYQGPVRVEWTDTIETGKGYRIRKLRYEAVPGMWIPALLYEPEKLDGKVPALLSVNGHVGDPGKSVEFVQARCITLAKRGVLALHAEWLFFGELTDPGLRHNDSAYLNQCGVSGLSIFYQAMKRGLDVLSEHPSVDPDRIAMTGLSGGGWQTIILSSLDTRIRVSVPNAGYVGLAVRADFSQDVGDIEQIPVDLLKVADYTHLTAMLAPRPALLIYNIKDDCCFQSDRVWPNVYEPIAPFYALFDAPDRFQRHENIDPGTHNYDRDNRLALYRFLSQQWNLGWPDEELSLEGEIRTFDELTVGVPDGNESFHSLARQQMADLPRPPSENDAETRKLLADTIQWSPAIGSVETLGELTSEGISRVKGYVKIKDWSVPFVLFETEDPAATATTILLTDNGKTSMVDKIVSLLNEGQRVIAIDLLYFGECTPGGGRLTQAAMMIDATGARLLGEQVTQLSAVIDAASEAYGDVPLHVHATGPNASVAALAAGAMTGTKIDDLRTSDGLASLKDCLAEGIRYDDKPALFTFGLLRHFDIANLQDLCPAFVRE